MCRNKKVNRAKMQLIISHYTHFKFQIDLLLRLNVNKFYRKG